MLIYEYECMDCGERFSFLVMSEDEKIKCNSCEGNNLKKLISSVKAGGRTKKFSSQDCCGMTSPCDNPKRCCEN
ncbi:MAG: FmdB family zinc ribbon protein [Elusimicrobiota bacterium]